MIARIEKELCNPVSVNGYCEVPGPLYHIYKVDEDGKKTFVKTVEKDIKEAAREAQRVIDIDVLEVAYKEKGPDAFSSVGPIPGLDNFVPNSDFLNKIKFKVLNDDDIVTLHKDGENVEMTWKDICALYTPSKDALNKLCKTFERKFALHSDGSIEFLDNK